MKTRIIVVPLIQNKAGEYLICKMPEKRGVFPGQWGIPGGGMEPEEDMLEALKREVREEVGLQITEITPWTFRDDLREKCYPNGTKAQVYMIYLIFDCQAVTNDVVLNDEFESYAWVSPERLSQYDLNEATRRTFKDKGLL